MVARSDPTFSNAGARFSQALCQFGREFAACADPARPTVFFRGRAAGGGLDRGDRHPVPRIGLLDDAAYAAGRVDSLHRRGGSLKAIRARLASQEVQATVAVDAVSGLRDGAPDP